MSSSNWLTQMKGAMHHPSYFSASQKSTVGTFISVSGTHEMKRPEHLSQSTDTHTVHSMELWVPDNPAYRDTSHQREVGPGFVIQAVICIHSCITANPSSVQSHTYIHRSALREPLRKDQVF